MKEWQFNVLFFVGVGSAILLLIGPEIGLNISKNPTAVTGVGAILTYVLTQRTRSRDKEVKAEKESREKVDNNES